MTLINLKDLEAHLWHAAISSLGLLMRQITKRTFFPSCSSNAFVMYMTKNLPMRWRALGMQSLLKEDVSPYSDTRELSLA